MISKSSTDSKQIATLIYDGNKSHVSLSDTPSKISVLRVLVKYYNDYPDWQSSWRGMGGVTYLYFGNVFVIPLGSKYADLQQKITPDTSCRKS